MITMQDVEDASQEYYVTLLANRKLVAEPPTQINYVKSMLKTLRTEIRERKNLEQQFASYFDRSPIHPTKDELISNVLLQTNMLKRAQRQAILAYVKHGNLAAAAYELKINYNTLKANFRHAIINLREMLNAGSNINHRGTLQLEYDERNHA